MIDSVRNMVMGILKKHNYGHLPVSDFNQFAKHAQLFIFDGLQENLNTFINREIARLSGSGVASMTDHIHEELDKFNRFDTLTYVTGNGWNVPTEATTGFDAYKIKDLLVYDGATLLGTAEYLKGPHKFRVMHDPYLQPPQSQPLYTIDGEVVSMFPATIDQSITATITVKADYVRYPVDPNWTFVSIGANGEPTFNASAVDYQDFELSKEFEYLLAAKILQMAGLSIREIEVYQYANGEEAKEQPPQQTYRR